MKKLLMMMTVAACATCAFADRVVISYLSLGPDKYANGAEVQEGEFYALVFVKAGAEFAGFNADGTLADPKNGEILEMGPWAKKWALDAVACPPHNIQPDDAEAAKYADGSFRLYVLDTRDVNGKLSGYVETEKGFKPNAVSGYGLASSVKFKMGENASTAMAQTSVRASVQSAVPPTAPAPKITGIRIKDGFAYLTVENTVPYLQYNVATGAKPGEVANRQAAEAPKGGDATKPIELKVPLTKDGQFFKVNRNGLAK